MLFGVDVDGAGPTVAAAAAAAPHSASAGSSPAAGAFRVRSSPSYLAMVARWLRGLVAVFMVRDELVQAMLLSGVHGNLERVPGESDRQWMQRFKQFHLRADGHADKEWSEMAQRTQGTIRTKQKQ